MEPAKIHTASKVSSDAAELTEGATRAQVAIDVLKDSQLTTDQVKQLQALLSSVSQGGAASATKSEAVGRIETVDGHQAVAIHITVNGQQLDTLLSAGSFNKTLVEQTAYAERLGYRMASREEHRAYLESLLAKEANKSINEAEAKALGTYTGRVRRDTQGGLDVVGRSAHVPAYFWGGYGYPALGALFVRASAEAK